MASRSKGGVKEKHWFEKTNGVSLSPHFPETRERESPIPGRNSELKQNPALMMAAAQKNPAGHSRPGRIEQGCHVEVEDN